jgi:hypothetical protein
MAILILSQMPPWWDVAWATWALVVVGLGGTIAAVWTLITIRRQTSAIERQVQEMRNTGVQTDRLIEEATKQSIAAKKSADALINTERAWIMVELEWVPGNAGRMRGSSYRLRGSQQVFNISAAIRFIYTNEGNTIGWIDEKLACFELAKDLAKQPDFQRLRMLDNEPEWVGAKGKGQLDEILVAEGQEQLDDYSYIWGVIRYRDALDNKHETVFGFRIRPDDRFERIAGLSEYNKST